MRTAAPKLTNILNVLGCCIVSFGLVWFGFICIWFLELQYFCYLLIRIVLQPYVRTAADTRMTFE